MLKIIIILVLLLSISKTYANSIEDINKDLGVWDQVYDLSTISLSQSFFKKYNYSGILKLPNCSASLVKLIDTDYKQALLLTNGHCLGRFPKPGTVVINKAYRKPVRLLNKSGKKVGKIKTTKILYSTMTRTDMALVELNKTYKQIKEQFNIDPLLISYTPPEVNDEIEIISGYWKTGFSCSVENIVYKLQEGGWTFYDSIGYTEDCKVYGGTSGSPIISYASGEVVGVNNTGNELGRKCTNNNPCQIDKDGNVSIEKDKGYGQNTFWIYNCLDKNSPDNVLFNFDQQDCKLLGPKK